MSSPESSSSAVRDESNGDLVGGLLTDAKELIDAHVDQLELEVRAEVAALATTIRMTAIAIAACVLAGLLLGQAAAVGLSAATGMPLWASLAIVGGALGIGGVLAYRWRPRVRSLVPTAAIAAIERDVARTVDAVAG
ncbi:MAG: phage holin family protein [Myxococcales bacterium]|jgi:hypothetical protein|nr:phage holin family protein [Myxococcales bacterium]MBK7196105.1 phage holin family protein [Myxococcales bacterium]